MSEKKLRKRAEEAELKENGLRETAPDECVPEEKVTGESAPEESAAEDFVQEELQIRLPGRTLDAHALARERVAHILSLGQEPSPSPYNAARLPGFLASCLNPVYLEEMNLQDLSREEQPGEEQQSEVPQGEHPEPAAGTASSGSDPVPLLNPAPLFNPALSAEQVEAACREYIRCCTAQLMRYAEPADELVVESLASLGAPLTLHYLLTGHIPDKYTWEHGEPDKQLGEFLHSVGAPAEGESALFSSANGYYTPGEHQMSRDKFGKALATRRLRWNRRMERTLNAEAHMAATCGAWLVTPADPLWPPQLNDLGPARPYGLWCRGDSRHLLDVASAPSVALVGSRDPSIYGTEATTHLAAELARRGYRADAALLDGKHDWFTPPQEDLFSALVPDPAQAHYNALLAQAWEGAGGAGEPAQMPVTMVIKGDYKCASIAAASVVAKVERDELMVQLDTRYPGYGWAKNKGYGSAAHREAISVQGPSPQHRLSWSLPATAEQIEAAAAQRG